MNYVLILLQILTEPKLRSDRWKSSSFLRENWGMEVAKYCSAEYFTKNITGMVYFEETCHEIPDDAIVIEIGPHGLLQSILKRSLNKSITNIALTSKNYPDNCVHVLKALGKYVCLFCYSQGHKFRYLKELGDCKGKHPTTDQVLPIGI